MSKSIEDLIRACRTYDEAEELTNDREHLERARYAADELLGDEDE